MNIIGFNHIQLDSENVERTRAYYEALGGTVTRTLSREGGWRGYHVRLGKNAVLEIQPPRIPEAGGGFDGWDHVALHVSDLDAACAAVSAAGGVVEKQPSPNQIGDQPIRNAVTLGPNGEKLELIELPEDEKRPDGSWEVLELHHVQLNCTDAERTRRFYEAAFGGAVEAVLKGRDGAVKGYMLRLAPGAALELAPPRFPLTGHTSAWNTLAMETEDVPAAIAAFERAGGRLEVGPMESDMGGAMIENAVVIGPEGEHVELLRML